MTVIELIALLAQCDPHHTACLEYDGQRIEITALDLSDVSRGDVYVSDRTADDTPDIDTLLFAPKPRPVSIAGAAPDAWENIAADHPMPMARVKMEPLLIEARLIRAVASGHWVRVTYTREFGQERTESGVPISYNTLMLLMPNIQIPVQTIVRVDLTP